jgi:hypothetical protein
VNLTIDVREYLSKQNLQQTIGELQHSPVKLSFGDVSLDIRLDSIPPDQSALVDSLKELVRNTEKKTIDITQTDAKTIRELNDIICKLRQTLLGSLESWSDPISGTG